LLKGRHVPYAVRYACVHYAQQREIKKGKTMQQILVTGGAGRLGRLVVKHLSATGYPVRGMSRRASPGEDWPGAEWKQADLVTGAGLPRAVQGMDVVVHTAGKGTWQVDFEGTRRLLDAARQAGVSHVVYISIVGIDKVPYAYGKAKLACEDLIQHSGIPWSILRATQFHYLIDLVLHTLTRFPLVTLLPTDLLLQPVTEEEVAQPLRSPVRHRRPTGLHLGGAGAHLAQAAWDASRHHPDLPAWQNGQSPAPGGQYLSPTGHRHRQLGSMAPTTL
jgi:uncharacterized protein YbjT (DUF2867 family)